MFCFIIFARRIMPHFLPFPLFPARCRFAYRKTFRVCADGCIFFICRHIDEQVIISARDIIMRRKPFMPVKNRFPVTQISSYSHVWDAGECIAHVLQGCMVSFPANHFIEHAFFLLVGAITQNNFRIVFVHRLHSVNPEFAGRYTVCICE